MKYDPQFTAALQAYVNAPTPDPLEGALLLYRINGQRSFYVRARHAPTTYAPIILEKLKSHLRLRLDGITRQEAAAIERNSLPLIRQTLQQPPPSPVSDDNAAAPVISTSSERPQTAAPHRGRRPDHDTLPPHIQQIPEANAERFFKMKETYNRLLQMEESQPCDRYELLKILRKLDTDLRRAWQTYDDYTAPTTTP